MLLYDKNKNITFKENTPFLWGCKTNSRFPDRIIINFNDHDFICIKYWRIRKLWMIIKIVFLFYTLLGKQFNEKGKNVGIIN